MSLSLSPSLSLSLAISITCTYQFDWYYAACGSGSDSLPTYLYTGDPDWMYVPEAHSEEDVINDGDGSDAVLFSTFICLNCLPHKFSFTLTSIGVTLIVTLKWKAC